MQRFKFIVVFSVALTLLFSNLLTAQSTTFQAEEEGPFAGVDVPFESWNYMADECGKFVYSESGTSICIPPNALEYEDGKAVQGVVTVQYREFHTPGSILLSGIPMEYTENGADTYLETGGMYEIRAFQNGKVLRVAEGMEFNIKMRSYANRTDLSFFKLDEDSGEWEKRPGGGARIANEVPEPETNPDLWGPTSDMDPENWTDDFWGEGEWAMDTSWWQINQFENDIFYSGGQSEFGIFNYDAILKKEPIVKIKSDFWIPEQVDREHVKIYVVYKDINSVFYFNPSDWEDRFYLYADRPAKIFAVLPGNRISMFDSQKLSSLNLKSMGGKFYRFQMEPATAALSSGGDVLSMLEIN